MRSKSLGKLLKITEEQNKKLKIQPTKIHESKDGRLIINPENKTERDWYKNF